MKKKTQEITFVGVHNRRTDLMSHIRENVKTAEIEELGIDYFNDGFAYFR